MALRPPGTAAPAGVVLRVLAGANAGAELPLGDGAWLVGRSDDADLTFAELALAPEHLRLVVGPGDLELQTLADGVRVGAEAVPAGETRALPLLTPVAVGATVFAIGLSGSEWPSPAAPASEPEALVVPQPSVATSTEPAALPVAATPARRRRRAWPVLAATAVTILALGTGIWRMWPEPPPPAPAAAPVDAAAAARAVIDALGLSDWVAVTADGARIVVAGQVRTEDEVRKITEGLRRAGVDASISIMTDAAALELVRTILTAFNIEAQGSMTGPGEVVLRGFAPDSGRVEMAVRRIRTDVPGLRAISDQIATPDRARLVLEGAVRAAGLGDALRIAAASPRGVSVTGALGPASMATWTAMATAFRKENGDRIPLQAQVAAISSAAPRGVQLGRNPALIMEDGRRLGVGDMLDTVGKIVAVDERRVRVRTAAGDMDLPYSRPPSWIMEEKDAR